MSVLKTYGADRSIKPSKTYKIEGNELVGYTDGVKAVEQSANLILSVDRFIYPIYSFDYGNELADLIGKDKEFVKGDIKRRILESLKEDDRITDITDFNVEFDRECARVTFKVVSTFGEFNMIKEVQ